MCSKNIAQSVFLIIMSPIVLAYLLSKSLLGRSVFSSYSQILSLIPGKVGSYMRTGFYRLTMDYCDKNTLITFGTIFSHHDTEVRENVYIGANCNIGKSVIQKGVLFGSGIHIMSGKEQHCFADITTPIQEQGGKFVRITIGEDTWIGNGALVMAPAGGKCMVGAGTVVTDEVPDYSIVVGNPGKVIRRRLPVQ